MGNLLSLGKAQGHCLINEEIKMDVTSITDLIVLAVAAAGTLGLAVLGFVAGIKNWKRLRSAS